MRFFLCPDKFKGSASSEEVISSMREGISHILPDAIITSSPISDGGEGFAQIAAQHLNGEWIKVASQDALHRPIQASYFIANQVAYIDMSATNGLAQIAPHERNPMISSTLGTGILVKDAVSKNVEKIYIGLGGSATNDGGAGMATALGAKFLDTAGKELVSPSPNDLMHCAAIDLSEMIQLPPIIAACDVNNPLLGENGATYVYGPQKGVIELADVDSILAHVMLLGQGMASAETQGAGAAGGIAYGLLHYCNAKLESGFDIISQITHLEEYIRNADIVITGEGSLDAQTLNGKGPHGVSKLAKKHQKRAFAIAGSIDDCVHQHFEKTYALADLGLSLETCMREAPRLITQLSEQLASEL